MSFSRNAATNLVPLLSRLVLAAAFIPAGWDKIMGDPIVYTGRDARILQELGIGEEVPEEALGHPQDVLAAYQEDVDWRIVSMVACKGGTWIID